MPRNAFEVPFPDGTVHYFETGTRVATHAVIAMTEYGHMEDGKFIVDKFRWRSWRESGSERAAHNALVSFAKDHTGRIQAYSESANDYRRHSDFRIVRTRPVARRQPMRFYGTLPNGARIQRVSQSNTLTHLVTFLWEEANKREDGSFEVFHSEWSVSDPFRSFEAAERQLAEFNKWDEHNKFGEWHERSSYHAGQERRYWVRRSQPQIVPLAPTTPRKKKEAV